MKTLSTIEECLEMLVTGRDFLLKENDKVIMTSINRQLKKSVSLTDRQYDLVKERVQTYRDQFLKNGYENFDNSLNQLKNPLRVIDRSKTISIVDDIKQLMSKNSRGLSQDQLTGKWIEVKFPFNKKTINLIRELSEKLKGKYYHENGNKEHYFMFTEKCVYEVITSFKDKNFKIDQEIMDFYEKCVNIIDNKERYLPSLSKHGLLNVHPKAASLMQSEIGEYCEDNAFIYHDRKLRYGLFSDEIITGHQIIDNIINRKDVKLQFKPSQTDFEQLVYSLNTLMRYPLIVTLDDKDAYENLVMVHSEFSKYLENSEQSVLFRNDNNGSKINPLNDYIHANNLNNKIDKNLKIVYIRKSKLPKPLFESEWTPICSLDFKSSFTSNSNVEKYVNYFCDLKVYYEEYESPLYKFSR